MATPPKGLELLPSRELNPRLQYLPEFISSFRPWQMEPISQIVQAFADGERVVVLDAPVGSGKTIIAEAVRMMLGDWGAFVCSGKELQVQFARDFTAPVLMGRSNYRPLPEPYDDDITCEDCDYTPGERLLSECSWCANPERCPYLRAKSGAEAAPVAALNSHYWLNATKTYGSEWGQRGLTVFDECDTLEDVLMSQAEVYISPRRAAVLHLDPPDRMSNQQVFSEWVEYAMPVIRSRRAGLGGSTASKREYKQLSTLISNLKMMQADIRDGYNWVYTGGAGSSRRRGDVIAFKPVSVARYGAEAIWGNSRRFLLMSGTVVSSQVLLYELGWTFASGDGGHTSISIPSPFPGQHRPVICLPVADLAHKALQEDMGALDRIADRIVMLGNRHPGRCLVHTVSYLMADQITSRLQARTNRPIFTYRDTGGRSMALENYKVTPDAILVASSMSRGIDLPDDLCRLQIIAKVPYPNLTDLQVKERTNGPLGAQWYNVSVARSVQQMCGRGVRHADDYCYTYILDSQFLRHYRTWDHFYPSWWRKAYSVERTG